MVVFQSQEPIVDPSSSLLSHSTSLSTTSIVLVSDVLYKAGYEEREVKLMKETKKRKSRNTSLRLLTFRDDLE